MTPEQRIWLLVSLKLSGEATKEERAELCNLLEQNPDVHKQLELLNHLWNDKQESSKEKKPELFDKHIQRLSIFLSEPVLQYNNVVETGNSLVGQKINAFGEQRRKSWRNSAIAASILLCWILFRTCQSYKPTVQQKAIYTVSTKRGSITNIR